jgi:pimeloyl-ACP methyl ester carboxylesterase
VPRRDISQRAIQRCGSDLATLKTASGETTFGIWIQAAAAKYTIFYLHGNAEDVGLSLSELRGMSVQCSANVFAVEYCGYSRATGNASEKNCYQCADAGLEYLLSERQIPPEHIVVFGRSLGSGPAVDVAQKRKQDVAGLILQSPLESGIRSQIGAISATLLFSIDIFPNHQKLPYVEAPCLIMHGTLDRVVPCSNGRALYKMLKQPVEPMWLKGRGHNDMPSDQVNRRVRKFLQELDLR